MTQHYRFAFALSLVFAIVGCVSQSTNPIPSETTGATTATTDLKAIDIDTPSPLDTPTAVPIASATVTMPLEPIVVSGWFSIPSSSQAETIDFSTAQTFRGIRIPPLPNGIFIEVYALQPYGEVPPETIFYQLYLVRQGNARMLWLGVPFKDTQMCCGQETPSRIYDSIPLPAIETSSFLIPFVCMRSQIPDIFLIAVAEPPAKDASAMNIHYAWRINPETTSLQPVSTEGVECSPHW